MNYASIIKYLYPTATNLDFSVVSYSTGERIEKWNIVKLGVQPTLAFLESKRAEWQAQVDNQLAQEQAATTDRQQIKAVALDLKNGVGTNAERLVRLEKAVYRILVDLYK